ncbi:unnamed protein product [Orchesella dallaii]|uniref:Calcium signal-modulating cyclophilin ligand n=1 Tax=Orchesella dallaii TaxID=48710 RepID=A0ABP1Q312_9HEXA
MADEDSGGAAMSDAEKRRLRRRQKILENQGARLQKIVGSDSDVNVNSSSSSFPEQDASLKGIQRETIGDDDEPPIEIFKKAADYGVGSNSNFPSTSATARSSTTATHSHQSTRRGADPPNLSSLLQELSGQEFLGSQQAQTASPQTERERGPRMGVQADGSVLLPRVSAVMGRVLICVLAFFLSLFGAKHYLITFMSWEFAFYWLNGLPPVPPPNMIMVLVALMGLKEQQLKRLKTFTHLADCMSTDFSLFLTGVLLPHIISNVVKTVG